MVHRAHRHSDMALVQLVITKPSIMHHTMRFGRSCGAELDVASATSTGAFRLIQQAAHMDQLQRWLDNRSRFASRCSSPSSPVTINSLGHHDNRWTQTLLRHARRGTRINGRGMHVIVNCIMRQQSSNGRPRSRSWS